MTPARDSLGVVTYNPDNNGWELLTTRVKSLLVLITFGGSLIGMGVAYATARAQLASKADRSELVSLKETDAELHRTLLAMRGENEASHINLLMMACRAPWNTKDLTCERLLKK